MRKYRFIMTLPSHTRNAPARASVEIMEHSYKAAILRFQRMFGSMSKDKKEDTLLNVPPFVVGNL